MTGTDVTRLLLVLAADAGAVLALMTTTAVVARRVGQHSVVDVAWGLGFGVVGLVSFLATVGTGDLARRLLVLVLPAAWGLRLAWHIGRRNAGKPEDPRYQELLAGSSASASNGSAGRALRRIYLPQGVAMFVVSLPIAVAATDSSPLRWWAWAGVAVWAVGLFFEAVGDAQLARFKADPANRARVMDRGLWRYTRHPNYFGDACVWWGIWLVAASSWAGLAAVVSPVLMNYLLVAKTGKALLERSLATRKPEYAEYVARTSGFLPLPPKLRRS